MSVKPSSLKKQICGEIVLLVSGFEHTTHAQCKGEGKKSSLNHVTPNEWRYIGANSDFHSPLYNHLTMIQECVFTSEYR